MFPKSPCWFQGNVREFPRNSMDFHRLGIWKSIFLREFLPPIFWVLCIFLCEYYILHRVWLGGRPFSWINNTHLGLLPGQKRWVSQHQKDLFDFEAREQYDLIFGKPGFAKFLEPIYPIVGPLTKDTEVFCSIL